jgi:uncharacterized damage-inducible protein DinB/GNAT superfamily N-acetyltransferase
MTPEELRWEFAYNTWANRRLLAATRAVPAAEFVRDRGASFQSIRGTLLHIVAGEWKWLRFWRGEPYDRVFPQEQYPTVAAIEGDWMVLAGEQEAFAAALTAELLAGAREARNKSRTLSDTIRHLLNHSAYHRGQVVTLLRQAGFAAPSTDFLDFSGDLQGEPSGAIRPATARDAEAIAALLADAFVEFQSLYTPDGYHATTPDRDEVQRRFTDGPVWIAEHDGAVAGTVSAVVRPDGVYIRGMAVSPTVRGRGVGRLLLNQVEQFALSQQRAKLYLSTAPFLSRAIRLYERAGYTRTSAPPYELFGTALFTMEKFPARRDVR